MPDVKLIGCSMMFLALAAASLFAAPGQIDPPPEKKWTLRWQSVNVNATSDLVGGEIRRTVQIHGQLHLHDFDSVLGVNSHPTITRLEDADGNALPIPDNPRPPRNFSNFFMHTARFQNPPASSPAANIYARLPVVDVIPDSYKRVAGYIEVLRTTQTRQQEVPLEKGDWVSLGGKLAIRVVDANVKPNSVSYRLEVKAEKADQALQNNLGNREPEKGPFPRIAQIRLIDADGNASEPTNTGGGIGGMNGAVQGHLHGSLSFTPARTYKTLRIELADALEVQKIPFELHDVAVPDLRP